MHYFRLYLWVPLVLIGLIRVYRTTGIITFVTSNFWLFALAAFVVCSASYSAAPRIAHDRVELFRRDVLPVVACGLACWDLKTLRYVRDMLLLYGTAVFMAFAASPLGLVAVLQGQLLGLTRSDETRLVLVDNAITTGYQLALLFVVAFVAYRRGVVMHKAERYGLLTFMVMAAGLLLLNGTRGAMAGLLVALIVFFARRGKLRLALSTSALMVMLYMGMLLVGIFTEHMTKRYQTTFSSGATERQKYSMQALSAPLTLLGRGVGSFGASMVTEYQPAIYTHNALTELYYEGGLVGLGLYILACGTAFVRLWRAAEPPDSQAATFCLAGFLVYFSLTQFSGYLLADTGFWLFLSMGSTSVRPDSTRRQRRRRSHLGSDLLSIASR